MTTFQFPATVHDGMIALPPELRLDGQEVEVVLHKPPVAGEPECEFPRSRYTWDDFIEKFRGCAKEEPEDIGDDPKYEYLMEKHRRSHE